MTDMRNFEPSNDIRAESAFVDSNAIAAQESKESFQESYVLEESGGLGEFHRNTDDVEEEGSGRGKAISALIVALMLGAAGAYAYSMWTPSQPGAVADASVPPPKVAAVTPPPPAMTPPADAMAPAPSTMAPAAPDVVKPAPVTKQERVANAPRVMPAPQAPASQANVTTAPVTTAPVIAPAPPENQAAAVPEPVSPTPPASALAGNPPLNEQSAPPAETPVTPTAETPVTPPAAAPAEATPAPVAPAEPAPAQ